MSIDSICCAIKVPLQPAKLVANAGEGHSRDDTTSCLWHLPSDLTHEVLRDLLLKWECQEHLEYEFKSSVGHSLPFPMPRIRELMGKLMDGRCFGHVGQDFIANRTDEVQLLHALCQKHICEVRNVGPAHDAQMLGYKLTQLGLDSLVTFDMLKSPAYFLRARSLTDSVSLADLTTYELLDHVFTAGWQVRALRYGQRQIEWELWHIGWAGQSIGGYGKARPTSHGRICAPCLQLTPLGRLWNISSRMLHTIILSTTKHGLPLGQANRSVRLPS